MFATQLRMIGGRTRPQPAAPAFLPVYQSTA